MPARLVPLLCLAASLLIPGSAAFAQAADDPGIRRSLQGIYSEIDALQAVQVDVSNQVVTLRGELMSTATIERAVELARNIDGVVEVNNELSVTADVGSRVNSSLDRLAGNLRSFAYQLPMIALALAVSVGGWFAGRNLARRSDAYARFLPNRFIADLVGNVTWLFATLAGIFLGLSLLDATRVLGTVLGAAGIVGLAVGFAVKDTVENYIASILMSVRYPFQARDYVQIGDVQGTVARLTSRATILISAEGNHIRIPNATVFKATIVNFTRNPQRRFEFQLGIHPDDDIARAQSLALATLDALDGVLADPPPAVLVADLGDFTTQLRIQAWIDQREHDMGRVRSEAIRLVKQAFDHGGVRMPYPRYDLQVGGTDPATQPTGQLQEQRPEQQSEQRPGLSPGLRPDRPADPTAPTAASESGMDAAVAAEIADTSSQNLLSGNASVE